MSNAERPWIRYDETGKASYIWICPYCRKRVYFMMRNIDCDYKFCPRCGERVLADEDNA